MRLGVHVELGELVLFAAWARSRWRGTHKDPFGLKDLIFRGSALNSVPAALDAWQRRWSGLDGWLLAALAS